MSNTKHTPGTETKPLWRVLNEQRTQGNWIFKDQGHLPDDEGKLLCLRSELNGGYISQFQQIGEHKNDAEANAKYTALAVNNLSHLAKALEKCITQLNIWAESDAWDERDEEAYEAAKEALSRIS